jgi:predicted transcriptional regulator
MITKVVELEEMIEDLIGRYRSILGLPRRNGKTLIEDTEHLLKIVKSNSNLSGIEYLICKDFNIKKNTFNYVLPTLERANLIMKINNNSFKLTFAGDKFLEGKNVCYVIKGFLDNYYGLLEVLLILSKEFPSSRVQIFDQWVSLYEKEFGKRAITTHRSQFNIILRYLIGFTLLKHENCNFVVDYDLLNSINELEIF